MRLLEGESEWEGRLEVCFSRRWGTVSSDGWTQTNTQVVCNDLGYDFTGKYVSSVIAMHLPRICTASGLFLT